MKKDKRPNTFKHSYSNEIYFDLHQSNTCEITDRTNFEFNGLILK